MLFLFFLVIAGPVYICNIHVDWLHWESISSRWGFDPISDGEARYLVDHVTGPVDCQVRLDGYFLCYDILCGRTIRQAN